MEITLHTLGGCVGKLMYVGLNDADNSMWKSVNVNLPVGGGSAGIRGIGQGSHDRVRVQA